MELTRIIELTALAVGVGAGIMVGIQQLREKRARKKNGLSGNPARCADHAERIGKLEACQAELKVGQAAIEATVKGVDAKVDKLLSIHLKND